MAQKGDGMAVPSALPGMTLTRVERLIVGVGALALGAWTAGAVGASYVPAPSGWRVALVVAVTSLTQLPIVRAFGGNGLASLEIGDAALLVGFVVVGPPWFVVLAAPCVLAVHLLARRPWLTALYSTAAFTAAAGLAYGVVRLMTTGTLSRTPRDVAALAVALLTFRLGRRLAESTLAAVADRVRIGPLLRSRLGVDLGLVAGSAVAAVGLLVLVDRDTPRVVTVPLALCAAFLVSRGYLAGRHGRHLIEQLELATQDFNQLDEFDVASGALRRARELFHCQAAELQLSGGHRRPPRVYEFSAGGSVVCRPGSVEVSERPAAASGTEVVTTLTGALGDIGRLRLVFEPKVRLTRLERRVLTTFGSGLSAAVVSALLYDDVRTESARQVHEATHDPLTGLANRVLLQEAIRAALAERHNLTTALVLLDLDHFKEINDTLGHVAGDVLLQRVADRLSSLSRRGDLVSRLGGDEFAVLLTGLESADAAGPAAETLLELLVEPVVYDGLRLSVEGSVGVACYPADASDPDELLRRAEVAMYQAKSDRGSWVRYEVRRDGSSVDRLALIAELRSALDFDEIVVHFQPQADLRTGLIVGVEALARWEHPVRGLLQPLDFVGVVEHSGLVRPFTLRVLDLAVAECAAWAVQGRSVTVAVNLAARSLLDRQLPRDVATVLARHSLPPDRLVLEITESIATSELEVVEEVLGRLRRLGVALSVDDFGTGYSNLAFLQRTAVNEVKVDRSFVLGMLGSTSDLALVRTTVQLAHSLGARAVAEGVEDAIVAEALRGLGCDLAQGYWLSRPVPAAEVRRLLGLKDPDRLALALPVQRAEQPRPMPR
jgi:diguanylate cyclase (GGDEF)-like protein